MKSLFSAVLGGLVVGAGLLLSAPEAPRPVAATIRGRGADGPIEDPAARDRLDALEDRLRDLQARHDPDRKLTPIRIPVEAVAAPDLVARIRQLEARIDELTQQVALTACDPLWSDDPEDARQTIEDAIARTDRMRYLGAIAGIPLRVRFLESWPRHEAAPHHLSGLVEDYLTTEQPHKASAAILRFGPRMDLPTWKLDALRLRAAHQDIDRVEIATRLASSPADGPNRAWAMRELARSLARLGRRAEALATIDARVTEFAHTDLGRRYVARLRELRKDLLSGR